MTKTASEIHDRAIESFARLGDSAAHTRQGLMRVSAEMFERYPDVNAVTIAQAVADAQPRTLR